LIEGAAATKRSFLKEEEGSGKKLSIMFKFLHFKSPFLTQKKFKKIKK